jgi:hypothetical protein
MREFIVIMVVIAGLLKNENLKKFKILEDF